MSHTVFSESVARRVSLLLRGQDVGKSPDREALVFQIPGPISISETISAGWMTPPASAASGALTAPPMELADE